MRVERNVVCNCAASKRSHDCNCGLLGAASAAMRASDASGPLIALFLACIRSDLLRISRCLRNVARLLCSHLEVSQDGYGAQALKDSTDLLLFSRRDEQALSPSCWARRDHIFFYLLRRRYETLISSSKEDQGSFRQETRKTSFWAFLSCERKGLLIPALLEGGGIKELRESRIRRPSSATLQRWQLLSEAMRESLC